VSETIGGMGRAGRALKKVLETYGISQNKLAIAMRIDASNVSRWVNESRDPVGDAIVEIKNALEKLDPAAAEDFVMFYLYNSNKGE
jgi:transcriptional regulator with XRE-family HTH domain